MSRAKYGAASGRKDRKAEKERKRQIEEANKTLFTPGKKTVSSLGILSVDPSYGVFRMADGRWIKCMRFSSISVKELILNRLTSFHGQLRLFWSYPDGNSPSGYFILTESGEIYEDVRKLFSEDLNELSEASVFSELTVDEVMNLICGCYGVSEEFSYSSAIRSKSDWKQLCFRDLSVSDQSFQVGGKYGECFEVISFRPEETFRLLSQFQKLGCDVYAAVDLIPLSGEDQSDYLRMNNKRFARRRDEGDALSLMGFSVSFAILCDSDDARAILEDSLVRLFSAAGVFLVPCFHAQKQSAESLFSFGLFPKRLMRCVDPQMVVTMLGSQVGLMMQGGDEDAEDGASEDEV